MNTTQAYYLLGNTSTTRQKSKVSQCGGRVPKALRWAALPT
ncbi:MULTISPECIES: hypothetical protein [unclassified Tolypothrix]|nr:MULTISPECIES: hypothetical protein [unclassified Tolypothrix]EKE98602.1 hypothetical protein FDUTEX481_03907 [Tolypothrix sp. PCC 7601]